MNDLATARALCFEQGTIASWYLRDDQLPVYYMLHAHRYPFIQAGRRWGKTTTILCYVLEQLHRNPGWICRWVFPEKNTAVTVIDEEMQNIQADCPTHLKFKWQTTHSVWLGPKINNRRSKLYLYGVDKDKGVNLRGHKSNIVVNDEFGFWSEPKIMNKVLRPTLLTTQGKMFICSTPAEHQAHPYYAEREKAIRLERFINRTILDNGSLTLEQIAEECEEQGGINSEVWRREYMCEDVIDPTKVIVPEFVDAIGEVELKGHDGKMFKTIGNVVPNDYPRPEFFTPYIGGDSGHDDNTAILFGYHDFQKGEFIVEYEFVTHGITSKQITDRCKEIEKDLWGDLKPKKRVYDAPKQLIYDMFTEYKWPVQMPDKADKQAAVHLLRNRVQSRKLKVKESCTSLRRQLKTGQWKNDRKEDFERTDDLGHLDAIAAAIYLNRSIDFSHNPVPHNHGVSRDTHFISPEAAISRGKTEDALARLLGAHSRRGRK
jgi:hypothetical protein